MMPARRQNRSVINYPKLVGIVTAMVLLSILFGMDRLSESGYIGLMGLLVGYLVGNGIAAATHEPVQPVIGHQGNTYDHEEPQ